MSQPLSEQNPQSAAVDSAILVAGLQEASLPLSGLEIERVIDVPLAVTLRFGQREMRLREVLELSPGSLIELDRRIEDPVDLLLGDRVIARGEVVIVDGNYGLRVTEISQAKG